MSETLALRAQAILHDWVQSESLRKHCYAVADSIKHFAQLRGEDADLWEAVGLLHDMDYERHPNLERLIEMGRIDHKFAEQVRTALASAEKNPNSRMLTPLVLEIIAEKL